MSMEQNIERAIMGCHSIRELQHLILHSNISIPGAKLFSPQEICALLDSVLTSEKSINYITRTYGLRVKVSELIQHLEPLRSHLISSSKYFVDFIPSSFYISGWKLHIYCESIEDVIHYYKKIERVLNSNNCCFKLSTQKFFSSTPKDSKQHGKGITIYLGFNLVHSRSHYTFIKKIVDAVPQFPISGKIAGDKNITEWLHYRYDLSQPFSSYENGVSIDAYKFHYTPNDGSAYNIPHNPDLFQL